MKRQLQAIRLYAVAMFLAACASVSSQSWTELIPEAEGGPQFHLTGSVTRMAVEGGVWVIRAQDGATYNAINLPQQFQVEGAVIEADARRRENVESNDMAGPKIDVLRIRRR